MELPAAERSEFALIAARLRAAAAALPPELRASAAPELEALLAGSFSPIVALLPRWLGDLAPLPPVTQRSLGEAGLWLWWYARALDDTLDGGPAVALLAGQQALLRALEGYRRLGLADTPAWAELHACAARSAAAYARELAARAVGPAALEAWSAELLAERAAPFAFGALAALELAGAARDAPLRADLPAALGMLAAARQIIDDAADCGDDLGQGRLNYAAAALGRSLLAEAGPGALSAERLAGRMLVDEGSWASLEREQAALGEAALERLRPYGHSGLVTLIEAELAAGRASWGQMAAARARLRGLLGLG